MNKSKILIVEDEGLIAIDIKEKLFELGFNDCEIAENIDSTLGKVKSFKPDLILLDINLNDRLDGIELADIIHKDKNTPIIFVTAYSDENTFDRAKITNPFGYLIKPFTANELNTSVNLALYKYDMEKKLKESEKRYRGLFDTAQVGIVTVSIEDHLISDCNKSFLNMMKIDDETLLIGKPMVSLYKDPSDYKIYERIISSKGAINRFEACIIRSTDEIAWFEGSSWINKNDNLIETVFIDITERKIIEDRLRQTQKMETVGQIAAGIAHEINTPLAVISTRLQILLDEIESMNNPSAVAQIENINKNIYRMSGIIERLLGFSRPQEMKTPVNINTLLEDVLFFVTTKAKKINIEMILNFAQQIPDISVYKNRIEQVFLNIIMNSFDAMSNGGSLQITSKKIKDKLHIIFKDSGNGMSSDSLKKIFEPFYTTKPIGKGTGLGMYISYGIVNEHDGDLIVRSKPKEGTTITVVLPLNLE